MHTFTPAWRLALVAAFALLLGPWASAQKLTSPADPRAESSSMILGLPDASAEAVAFPSTAATSLADILNETFTSTFTGGPPAAPPGWIQLRTGGTSTSSDWVRWTSTPCSTTNPCAKSNFASPLNARYLVSPQVTPSAAAGNLLTFRVGNDFSTNYVSSLQVAVSTGGATTAEFDANVIRTINDEDMPVDSFGNFSVDLSAYNGVAVYIALIHNQNDGDTFWLDDVRIAEPTPATFTSTTLQFQNTGFAGRGEDTWVVASNVIVGGTTGTVEATELTFSTTGSTSVADISSARLLYSGASTTFNYQTTPVFGSPVVNPNGTITFTGSQALPPGNNYFILVYAVSSSAGVSNVLDATYESAVVAGSSRTPTATTLTGSVSIVVRPPNNDLLRAFPITSSGVAVRGTNLNANSEAGELLSSCQTSSTSSVWWSYTPSADGTASFSTEGSTATGSSTPSSFDTVVSIHTGTGHPLTQVACDDDSGANNTSLISSLAVTAGTTYWIRASGWSTSTGTFVLTVTGPAPESGDFTFSRPSAGQTYLVGRPLKPIWSDATTATDVRVSLCRASSSSTCVVTYSGSNLEQPNFGAARYIIPAGTTPATDYYMLVQDASDPSSFGVSGSFTISDPSQAFVVTAPSSVLIGSTSDITWSPPSGASSGTVLLEIVERSTGNTAFGTVTENDGVYEKLWLGFNPVAHVIRLTSVENPGYFGQSGSIRFSLSSVTSPTASTVCSVGTTCSATWSSPTLSSDASVRVSVGKVSLQDFHFRVRSCTANTGSCDFTPSTDFPEGNDYVLTVKITDCSSGTCVSSLSRSEPFTVTGGPVRVAASAQHFAMPVPVGDAWSSLTVQAPGMADGAEIAAFAGDLLVGAGVVQSGQVRLAVRGEVAEPTLLAQGLTVEEATTTLAEGTELTLRAWSQVAGEFAYEAGRVTDEDGTDAALAYAYGADLTVAAKGASTSAADAFALVGVVPNPMSGAASVRFTLPESQAVRVTVYDVLGREVVTLLDATAPAGAQAVAMPASLNAGVYVVRVSTDHASATSRFTVVR